MAWLALFKCVFLLAVSLLSISETHAGNKLLVKSSNRTNVFAL